MNSKLEAELCKAAVLTFEDLGFMFPTRELDEDQKNAQFEATVSVEFEGPLKGKLEIAVYGGMLPTIAANMLGEEEIPSQSQQRDALGEIVNVVCGNMLPGIAGPAEVFHVGVPQVNGNAASLAGNKEAPVAEVQLGLDRGRADLRLFLDSEGLQSLKEQE